MNINQSAINKLNDLHRTEPILNPEFNPDLGGIGLGDFALYLYESSLISNDEVKRYAFMMGS